MAREAIFVIDILCVGRNFRIVFPGMKFMLACPSILMYVRDNVNHKRAGMPQYFQIKYKKV